MFRPRRKIHFVGVHPFYLVFSTLDGYIKHIPRTPHLLCCGYLCLGFAGLLIRFAETERNVFKKHFKDGTHRKAMSPPAGGGMEDTLCIEKRPPPPWGKRERQGMCRSLSVFYFQQGNQFDGRLCCRRPYEGMPQQTSWWPQQPKKE